MKQDKRPGSRAEHIRQVLETVLEETGLEERMRDNRALLHWNRAAGEKASRHTEAAHVEQGTLFVDVDNTVWMHQLQMQESELRDRLNQEIENHTPGHASIGRIRFRLGRSSVSTEDDLLECQDPYPEKEE